VKPKPDFPSHSLQFLLGWLAAGPVKLVDKRFIEATMLRGAQKLLSLWAMQFPKLLQLWRFVVQLWRFVGPKGAKIQPLPSSQGFWDGCFVEPHRADTLLEPESGPIFIADFLRFVGVFAPEQQECTRLSNPFIYCGLPLRCRFYAVTIEKYVRIGYTQQTY
jgi:hypothetical protein